MGNLTGGIVAVGAFVACAVGSASAQESPPTYRLEPIVVTATRTTLGEQAPSASTTVIDRRQIQTSSDVSVDDVLRTIPGFSLYRRSSSIVISPDLDPEAQGVTLRGIGPSGASHALVLVDGIPIIDAYDGQVFWGKISKEQIDHIEVVRGGMANLWGNYAMAGVINIITRKPEDNEAAVRATYGEHGLTDDDAMVHGRVGNFGVTLEGNFFDTDGFPIVAAAQRGPVDGNASSRHETFNGRVSYHLSDSVSVALFGQFFDEAHNDGTPLRGSTTQSGLVGMKGNARTDDGSEWQFSVFSNMQQFDIQFSEANADRTAEHRTQGQTITYYDVAGSAVWSKQVIEPVILTGGVDLHWVDGQSRDRFFDEQGIDVETRQRSDGKQFFAGLFAQAIYAPAPRWQITLGGRLDVWDNLDGTQTIAPDTGPATATSFPDRTDATFNPKLGVFYRVADWLQMRAAAYRAFRAPTLAELYRRSAVEGLTLLPNPDLGAEDLYGAEAGFDLPLTERVDLRATGFWDDIRDPIAEVDTMVDPATGVATERRRKNLGRARTVGCEAEALYEPLQDVTLSASYLFADATIASSPGEPDLEGNRLAQIPQHAVTARAQYSNPKLFTFVAEGRFTDDQFEDEENLQRLTGYFVLNASLSRRLPFWNGEVFIAGENLADRDYPVDRGGGILNVGTPRTVYGGVRFRL